MSNKKLSRQYNAPHTLAMRIQIISDIHLELRNNRYPKIQRKAPNIALLGDIGKPFSSVYRRLVHDLSRRFHNVIIVAGNHEFYSTKQKKITVSQVRDRIREIADSYPNVHFLDNNSLMLDGVRILGCTLWTDIPAEVWPTARRKMNDYRMCFIEKYADLNVGVPLAPHHTVFWHDESVSWLKRELGAPGHKETPTVILTHHCPYDKGTSAAVWDTNDLQCCYFSDLSSMFSSPIVAWGYGHTHYPFDRHITGVRVVSNPLGYPGELDTAPACLADPPIIDTAVNWPSAT
jgi:predicted phosphodiesterase